jgi:hypothetical protein
MLDDGPEPRTTHDLALTEMAVALGPAASNVHFEVNGSSSGAGRFEDRRREHSPPTCEAFTHEIAMLA